MLTDTIAAIATPLGEGGIAVIRVSGPRALEFANACFHPAGRTPTTPSTAATHTVHYGHIRQRDGTLVDEVLLTVLRAPRTFTREDTVEVSCHGGVLPAKLVLEAFLAAGARAAEPGEFTRRAFLNGRIDLTQAEAVADIIHARTELALAAANEQLSGSLSREIHRLRDDLMTALAHVEAHIDFPDEDLSPDTQGPLTARMTGALSLLDHLLQTAREGQILRRGIRAAIIGRPNAGKSSLLNRLLGHSRAIVSPVPGTTRDTIEETAGIRGLPVVFIDTAGLRSPGDAIEEEGIRRSRETISRAELVLHVTDMSQPWSDEDRERWAEVQGRAAILVCNKADLPPGQDPRDLPAGRVEVSCETGAGIEALKDRIRDRILAGTVRAGMFQATINARHQEALRRGRDGIDRARTALVEGRGLEIVAMELRIGVQAIGEVVGKTATEDLLDAIFSQFCIGK
jgi:tRNA modification GTPase